MNIYYHGEQLTVSQSHIGTEAPAPSDSGSDAPLGFPRRSLGLLGLLPGLGSSPVRAEQGWQLKLPRRGRDGGMVRCKK